MVKNLKADNKAESTSLITVVIVALFIVLALVMWAYGLYMDTQHSTVYDKITKAERVTSKDGKSAQYVVWGNNETYTITDTIINKRWNSSDLYGKIQVGKTYKMDVVGYRFDVTSHYRNILTAEEVSA